MPNNAITSAFTIQGMTCESCAQAIIKKVTSNPDVISAKVNLEADTLALTSGRKWSLPEMRQLLSALPKYTVQAEKAAEEIILQSQRPTVATQKSFLTTYKPLIILFVFIWVVSLSAQLKLESFNPRALMWDLMAGFFIGFSFFKFLDLKAFAESFSGYDPIAKRWLSYGYAYPFIELSLGLMFMARLALPIANGVTLVILGPTTLGVYRMLRSPRMLQCACLGSMFNLPLSNVTIAENLIMMLMAASTFFF